MKKKQISLFILITCIEIALVLWGGTHWLRLYGGDILIIPWLYFLLAIFIGEKSWLSYGVLLIAVGVELLQLVRILECLQLSHVTFLRVIFGSTFDVMDLIGYVLGFLLVLLWRNFNRGKVV